jgi:hypothetical protein
MFLRLTIACCFASISAAQDIPQSATREIAAAANEFVGTLDESQRGKLIYDFRDEAQRKRWHYFPPGMFPRGGLRVGDLAERQRAAAMPGLAGRKRQSARSSKPRSSTRALTGRRRPSRGHLSGVQPG